MVATEPWIVSRSSCTWRHVRHLLRQHWHSFWVCGPILSEAIDVSSADIRCRSLRVSSALAGLADFQIPLSSQDIVGKEAWSEQGLTASSAVSSPPCPQMLLWLHLFTPKWNSSNTSAEVDAKLRWRQVSLVASKWSLALTAKWFCTIEGSSNCVLKKRRVMFPGGTLCLE